MAALKRAGMWFSDLQAAAGRVDSLLGQFPGLSQRAAAHLADISRLTAATGAVMRAAEGELLAAVPLPIDRSPDTQTLGTQARLLANDIVGLIEIVRSSKHQGTPWDAVSRDLQELFTLVQSFERTLAQPSTNKEIESSLRAVRRRMWQVEARIAQLGWPRDLDRAWRGVRERLNIISDSLGLPRVIALAKRGRPNEPLPAATPRRPETRIYRGPPQ
jgi:hypothetical protein